MTDDASQPAGPSDPGRTDASGSADATPAPDPEAPPIMARPVQALPYASPSIEPLLVKGPPQLPVLSVGGTFAIFLIVGALYFCAGASALSGAQDSDARTQAESLQNAVAVSEWLVFLLLPLLLVKVAGKDLRMVYSWHAPRWDLTVLTLSMAMCLVGVVQYVGDQAFLHLSDAYDRILEGILPSTAERMAEVSRLIEVDTAHGLVLGLLLAAVTPAICEEHFFRGLFQSSLDKHIPAVAAIAVSATFFAAFHVEPVAFAAFFLIGLLAGTLTSRTSCLLYAVLIHLINNAYAILVHAWMIRNVAAELVEPGAGSLDSLPIYLVGGVAGLLAFLARSPRRRCKRLPGGAAAKEPARFRPGSWRRSSLWLARRWRLAAVFALVCSVTGFSLDVRDLKEIAAANPKTQPDDAKDDDGRFRELPPHDDLPPAEEQTEPEVLHVDGRRGTDQSWTEISATVSDAVGAPGPRVIVRSAPRPWSCSFITTW
jgi:membrane protease YdiL (CAAX protease family)